MLQFWKGIQTASIVTGWIATAAADGKITLEEIVDLARQIGRVWGFEVEIDVSALAANQETTFSAKPTEG